MRNEMLFDFIMRRLFTEKIKKNNRDKNYVARK